MKKEVYILVISLILISCKAQDSKHEWNEIKKSGSVEKYQDYLIKYPQTKHLSEITDSLRNFWKEYAVENWHYDCFGNCLILLINKNGELLFENKQVDENDLKEKIKYSILNPEYSENLPEKEPVLTENLGEFMVSRGMIDIIADKELNVKKYSQIIKLVKESFIEMREWYSNEIFGKPFKNLDEKQKKDIEIIVPMRIRFERYLPVPKDIPPPPPRPSAHEKYWPDSLSEDEIIELEKVLNE